MIRLKLTALALATPLLLSGCIIIDADDADVRSVSVIHERGGNTEAAQEAIRECGSYGETGARLVDVDDTDPDGKVRSLYECY